MRTIILYVYIKYSTCDIIRDVISCCVLRCDTGKINVAYMIKSWFKQEQKKKNGNERHFFAYISILLLTDGLGMEFKAC